MSEWQINLRELFKIVTAGAALYAWMTYWSPAGSILVGILLAAAVLFWPAPSEADWAAKVARSIASLLLALCLALWGMNGMLLGAFVIAALWICPKYDDEYWTFHYVASNALLALAIMLGFVLSVLRICTGR